MFINLFRKYNKMVLLVSVLVLLTGCKQAFLIENMIEETAATVIETIAGASGYPVEIDIDYNPDVNSKCKKCRFHCPEANNDT